MSLPIFNCRFPILDFNRQSAIGNRKWSF